MSFDKESKLLGQWLKEKQIAVNTV